MAAFASALAHQIQTLATEIGKLDKQLQAAYEAGDMQLYSGNSTWVHRRYSRPHFIHQTFWECAKQSYMHCQWAKHYVDAQIAKGKKHSTAVRSLAFKWIRIMFACWKRGTPYDDAKYLQALRQKNSPLAANLPVAA